MTIAVYNSAGEIVRQLITTGAYSIPDTFTLDKTTFSPDDGGKLHISVDQTSATWDGTNQQNVAVGNGTYYIKVSIVDTYGFSHTIVKEVTLLTNDISAKLEIYNSAGEVVKRIDIEGLTTTGSTKLDVTPSGNQAFSPGDGDSSNSNAVFTYMGKNITWDGTNDGGMIVGNGVYRAVVVRTDANGYTTVAEAYITVLHNAFEVIANVKIIPNPINVNKTGILTIKYDAMSGAKITVKIYDLAGELVRELHDYDNASMVTWDVRDDTHTAHGLYVAVIYGETKNGMSKAVIAKFTIIK
jgi:flagellar hook assembly protein FlgD